MHTTTSLDKIKYFEEIVIRGYAIDSHIPIIDVSLIVQDYLAVPTQGWDSISNKNCVICLCHNSRRVSAVCKNCVTVCVQCRQKTCKTENKLLCESCKDVKLPSDVLLRKDSMYVHLHRSVFPSDLHKDVVARKKREAADPVIQARKAEEEKRKNEFYFSEFVKPADQQIAELRQKLWDANHIINHFRECHPGYNLPARPQFPFY